MQSRKTCTSSSGFSLIEVVVVLGILAVLASFALVISMESYRGSSFNDERSLLISMLQTARSQAMSGVCIGSECTGGVPHGVYITSNSLALFQGTSYNASDDNNEVVPFSNRAITLSGAQQVIFAEFTGDATATTITLKDAAGRSATITIGSEGQILW